MPDFQDDHEQAVRYNPAHDQANDIHAAGRQYFFGGIFGWKAWMSYQSGLMMSSRARPPVTVSAIIAIAETWTPVINSVGTLRASRGVDVTAREAGMITALRFASGAPVAVGDVPGGGAGARVRV